MVNLFGRLTSIGINPRMDRTTQQQVRITNSMFILTLPLYLFYAGYNFYLYDGSFVLFYFSLIGIGAIVPTLNYYNQHNKAKWICLLFNVFVCFLLQYLFGSQMVIESLILIFVVFVVYLIDNRQSALFLILFISIGFVGLKLIEMQSQPPLNNRVRSFTPIVFFIASVSIISLFIIRRRKEVVDHLKEKSDFEARLQHKNELLGLNKILIEQQNQELEKKNEELNQFAYIAAHDLKTPVRNIQSFAQLASKHLKDSKHKKVEDYISIISDSSKHLNDLIHDLLSYSLLEKDSIDMEWVELTEIFNSTKSLIQGKQENAYEILSSDLPKAFVNPLQFKLLFQNLIENGLKYNINAKPKITLKNVSDNNYWRISFKDNGIGVDEKYQKQIFEMFERLHSNDDFEGSGLGLAICKKIIGRHSGTIKVEESSNKGTEFIIEWPTTPMI